MKLSLFSNCHDLDPYTYKNPKHWRQKVFTGMSKKIVLCEQNVGYLILGNLISYIRQYRISGKQFRGASLVLNYNYLADMVDNFVRRDCRTKTIFIRQNLRFNAFPGRQRKITKKFVLLIFYNSTNHKFREMMRIPPRFWNRKFLSPAGRKSTNDDFQI